MLREREVLERVAVVSQIGNARAIGRRPEATLRDIELSLSPMLASNAEPQAIPERLWLGIRCQHRREREFNVTERRLRSPPDRSRIADLADDSYAFQHLAFSQHRTLDLPGA